MHAHLPGPLHTKLQGGKLDGRKGSNKILAWTTEAEEPLDKLKESLLDQLVLFFVDPDKEFVLRTHASDYALRAVLEHVRGDGTHVLVAYSSQVLAGGQRLAWMARKKQTYAIVCALWNWSRHMALQPVVVCTDLQSLQSWHKEHVGSPTGPAAKRARWQERFAKFNLSVVYVPGKDNTVADCLSCWAYPAGKALMEISSHENAGETEGAKRIIQLEKATEEGDIKCLVLMASKAELSQRRDARVSILMEETLEECLMAPIEYVESVLLQELSEDYATSE